MVAALTIRMAMEREKPRTPEYLIFRDCLILYLYKDRDLMLGNIADEVGIGLPMLKKILKKYDDEVEADKAFTKARKRLSYNWNLSRFVCKIADRKDRCTDTKKLELAMLRQHGHKVSQFKLRRCLR